MIKFFRHIRQKLLSEDKFKRYLLYAIGEIVLVVIGILIALSINNWNNNIKDKKLEQQYISGLIDDLQADSIAISLMKVSSDEQMRRKNRLLEYFKGKTFSNDSIAHFFSLQWTVSFEFNPITVTIDELKSTGRFGIIQNVNIRKQIISTYNTYTIFTDNFISPYERNKEELRKITLKIPGALAFEKIIKEAEPDIIDAFNDVELKNRLLANYVIAVNNEIGNLQNENQFLLKQLKNYLSEL